MVGNRGSRKDSLLSEERIVDSDTDGEDSSGSVTGSRGSGNSESVTSREKPSPREKLTATSNASTKDARTSKGHQVPEGEGSIESSEEDEDDEEDEDKEEREEDEGSERHPSPITAKRTAQNAQANHEPRRKKQKSTLVPIPAVPFVPDRGFEKLAFLPADYTLEFPQLLSSNMNGKQIWHIMAPANVPVKSIQSFSLSNAQSDKAIVQHNGVNYGFFAESPLTEVMLLPEGIDLAYTQSASKVNSTFYLREINEPEAENTTSPIRVHQRNYVAQHVVKDKPVRQQPQGLRMHYTPFGPGSNDPENVVSDESDAAEDTFRVPAPLPQEPSPQGTPQKATKDKSKKQKSQTSSQKTPAREANASQSSQSVSLSNTTNRASKDPEATNQADSQSPRPEKQKRKKKKRKLVDEDDSKMTRPGGNH